MACRFGGALRSGDAKAAEAVAGRRRAAVVRDEPVVHEREVY